MNSSTVQYASRSKALRDLNAWIEMRAPIPPGSVAYRLVQETGASGENAGLSQDIWFRDWPKGYDLVELAKHYPAFDETFSLIWFEQDSGPDEPVKNWSGVPAQDDDEVLKELDGVMILPLDSVSHNQGHELAFRAWAANQLLSNCIGLT